MLYVTEIDTPIGPMTLMKYDGFLVRADYGLFQDLPVKVDKWKAKFFPDEEFNRNDEYFTREKDWFEQYFNLESPTISINLQIKLYGTDFQGKVWKVLAKSIPYGETRTYKMIAEYIDKPRAVRAVGGAINKNPISIIIPCHRVIGVDGGLTGYNGGLDKKAYLLKLEKKEEN